MRLLFRGTTILVLLISLTGCSNRSETLFVEDECPRDGAGVLFNSDRAPQEIDLPKSFLPVSIVKCSRDPNDDSGVREEVAVLSKDLSSSLILPDVELPADIGCGGPNTGILFLLVADADGRAVRPRIPSDSCGVPRTEVQRALDRTAFMVREEFAAEPSPTLR